MCGAAVVRPAFLSLDRWDIMCAIGMFWRGRIALANVEQIAAAKKVVQCLNVEGFSSYNFDNPGTGAVPCRLVSMRGVSHVGCSTCFQCCKSTTRPCKPLPWVKSQQTGKKKMTLWCQMRKGLPPLMCVGTSGIVIAWLARVHQPSSMCAV